MGVYCFEASLVWTLPHLSRPNRWLGLVTVVTSGLHEARKLAVLQVSKRRRYQSAAAEYGWRLRLRGRIPRGKHITMYSE